MAKEAIWLIAALATALGILADMHQLRVNRVGNFGRRGWVSLGVLIGPLAVVPYVPARSITRRALIASVWLAVGDDTHSLDARRTRLMTLRDQGLIGRSVFSACLAELDGAKTSTQ